MWILSRCFNRNSISQSTTVPSPTPPPLTTQIVPHSLWWHLQCTVIVLHCLLRHSLSTVLFVLFASFHTAQYCAVLYIVEQRASIVRHCDCCPYFLFRSLVCTFSILSFHLKGSAFKTLWFTVTIALHIVRSLRISAQQQVLHSSPLARVTPLPTSTYFCFRQLSEPLPSIFIRLFYVFRRFILIPLKLLRSLIDLNQFSVIIRLPGLHHSNSV